MTADEQIDAIAREHLIALDGWADHVGRIGNPAAGDAIREHVAGLRAALAATHATRETELCGVCCGGPLASGRKCICDGVGTEQGELQGLRRACFQMENDLARLQGKPLPWPDVWGTSIEPRAEPVPVEPLDRRVADAAINELYQAGLAEGILEHGSHSDRKLKNAAERTLKAMSRLRDLIYDRPAPSVERRRGERRHGPGNLGRRVEPWVHLVVDERRGDTFGRRSGTDRRGAPSGETQKRKPGGPPADGGSWDGY